MLSKKFDITAVVISILFSLGFFFSTLGIVSARVNNNDNVVAPAQLQDNVSVKLDVVGETTATSTVLVDLSDTTNFKHGRTTGTIEVSQIKVNWTTDVIATTTLKFGLVASSSPSGAVVDVYWFDELSFSSTDLSGAKFSGRQEKILDYSPSAMKLDISSGAPASFATNDSSTSNSSFATTTSLISPKGYSAVGVGDLVMSIYDQKGTATTSVTAIYRVK